MPSALAGPWIRLLWAATATTGSVTASHATTDAHFPMAIVGDTQRTLWVERLVRRAQNDESRDLLSAAIAAAAPRTFIHLGDLVSYGSSPKEWQRFDAWVEPIRASGAKAFAVVGNHDTWGAPSLTQMRKRFPELSADRHYGARAGDLDLLFLDSNLTKESWDRQRTWLEASLAAADDDPTVRGVMIFLHHPPFTLARGHAGHRRARAELVPSLFRSSKVLAVFSGHAHGYERFEAGGKTFVVSGGGGGPRVEYRGCDEAPAGVRCAFDAGSGARPFHFVWLAREQDTIVAEVRTVPTLERPFADPVDRFVLELIPAREPPP
ncbi:MAG: metallophosphoesterase [Deltaproteobacteria bacterium]|nr:metallophosphoesterase [Deltaproteobacteria bacterium]